MQDTANRIADSYGVSRETLSNLVTSESQWNPTKVSDTGDYGLVQINIGVNNPDVTVEQALNPEFALSFAAKEIANGHADRWTVCNCYQFTKAVLGKMPPMAQIAPNSSPAVGSVAILDYHGQKHVAVVVGLKEGGVEVREANFEPCKTGTRIIEWNDSFLKGFWLPK